MNIAIGQSVAPNPHVRHANFGSLVSAINRGDIEGARNAFEALSDLGPKAPGPLRKGALDAMAKALQEADLSEAKKALKALQQANLAKSPDLPPDLAAP